MGMIAHGSEVSEKWEGVMEILVTEHCILSYPSSKYATVDLDLNHHNIKNKKKHWLTSKWEICLHKGINFLNCI